MPIDFDKFIKDNIVYYNPDYTLNNILESLEYNWDIIAFRDEIIIPRYKNIALLHRDAITNIKSENALLFYNKDGIKYPIRDDTRIIPTLTPFKKIYINAFSNEKKVKITFTRLLLNNVFINKLRKEIVYDNTFVYCDGKLI